jgi:hypothetical protein
VTKEYLEQIIFCVSTACDDVLKALIENSDSHASLERFLLLANELHFLTDRIRVEKREAENFPTRPIHN